MTNRGGGVPMPVMANSLLPGQMGDTENHHDFILSCVSIRRETTDARGCEQYKDR